MVWLLLVLAGLAVAALTTPGSRRAGCGRGCSRSSSPACPPSSTGFGSPTSPTSTSVPRAKPGCVPARGRLGRRAQAGPRVRHRRSRLASSRGAAAARAARPARPPVRGAGEPRCRGHTGSVLGGGGAGGPPVPRRCSRMLPRRLSCEAAACSSSAWIRAPTADGARTRGAGRSGCRHADSPLPLPGRVALAPQRGVPPCPVRAPALGAARPALPPRWAAHAGAPAVRARWQASTVERAPCCTVSPASAPPSCRSASAPGRGDGVGTTIIVMDGQSTISADVLGSYAADAAREVPGVHGIVEGGCTAIAAPRRGG